MELFDIGLKSVVETSPDFDESPIEPPAKKIHKRKAATKKERERLLKEICQLPLSEVTTFCFTRRFEMFKQFSLLRNALP